MTLEEYRKKFEHATNRSIAMPLAGTIVWLFVGLVSLTIEFNNSVYFLLFATGAILPIALVIARFRNEALLASVNPLSKLMGLSVLMVNLLWGVHFPIVFLAPEFVPLSLGVGLGLHWVVYSWVIGHPLGIIHAVLRTFLVVGAWLCFPESRIFAVSLAVVISYLISLVQMFTRKIELT